MIKYLLLTWWLMVSSLAAAEVRERAYYFGKQHISYWEFVSEASDGDDPFAEDQPEEESTKPKQLEKVPYLSKFLRSGDVLWDLTSSFRTVVGDAKEVIHATYNQTTGRVVLVGGDLAHSRLGILAKAETARIPRMIKLAVRVYRVPREGFGVSSWDASKVAQSNECLVEASLMTKVGQASTAAVGDGLLEIDFEPNVGRHDEWIDLRLALSGKVDEESFKVATGITGYNECPAVIELGGIGDEDVLLLWVKPEIYFVGGEKPAQLVLDAAGELLVAKGRLRGDFLVSEEGGVVDPKTGKVFKQFIVPPIFLSFLDAGAGDDPFAEDGPTRSTKVSILKKWNPKVIARPWTRVLDLQELFKLQGVRFSEGDFICMVEGGSTVYAETSPESMELLDAIIGAGHVHPPRMVACGVTLVEGSEEVRGNDLKRGDVRSLAKICTVSKPGQKAYVELREGERRVVSELELNVCANDSVLDLRGDFVLKDGEDVLSQWKSGMTFLSGEKQIVHSYRRDGKWYALVVELRALWCSEWLFPE